MDRDKIEAGADLSDVEIEAAKTALRRRAKLPSGHIAGCTSYVQRSLGIGYNHASRIMEFLEAAHFITPPGDRGERRLLP